MTVHRATGPGPRTVAPSGATQIVMIVLLGLLVAGVVACATSGPTVSGSDAPGSSGVPGASGVGNPEPSLPRWPGTTVLAVIALGAADGEIQKAGVDLQDAADKQDLKAMWGAADGLAKLIEGLMPNLDRLDVYAGTQPVGALYRKAFPQLSAGARQLRDSITSGDSAGVVAGSQLIARGLADYAPIRREIAALVEQAIVQQRLLLQ